MKPMQIKTKARTIRQAKKRPELSKVNDGQGKIEGNKEKQKPWQKSKPMKGEKSQSQQEKSKLQND